MTPSNTAPRDIAQDSQASHHDPDVAIAGPILLTVFVLLAAWAGSVVMWGIPGLYIPAVALVPVMMGLLIWISRG
ncbi:hypothetical protein KPG71_01325 [Roseovarius sp. PS-C2]|uniref:hypothetical protein n=1 Tax=Roseovarius sp. PS-C2 TaxID=2820814 RepID=UPI001C0BB6E7|nr:hypothetical protein [Roseovarius sp. PS-C2]MBU3258648.1 hypothetical protein [Roseovarius sp. PS-C2]